MWREHPPRAPARPSPDAGAQASATTGASGVASSPLLTADSAAGSFIATAAVSGKEPTGGSGGETSGTSAGGAATPVSFSLSNLAGKPAKLTPGVGSPQSTPAGTPFPIRLALTVTDAQSNPVPNALLTFSAPPDGASGRFTLSSRDTGHRRTRIPHARTIRIPPPRTLRVSHPHTVRVRTNACGIAVAPTFTANGV